LAGKHYDLAANSPLPSKHEFLRLVFCLNWAALN